jgi:hypothetical protein
MKCRASLKTRRFAAGECSVAVGMAVTCHPARTYLCGGAGDCHFYRNGSINTLESLRSAAQRDQPHCGEQVQRRYCLIHVMGCRVPPHDASRRQRRKVYPKPMGFRKGSLTYYLAIPCLLGKHFTNSCGRPTPFTSIK